MEHAEPDHHNCTPPRDLQEALLQASPHQPGQRPGIGLEARNSNYWPPVEFNESAGVYPPVVFDVQPGPLTNPLNLEPPRPVGRPAPRAVLSARALANHNNDNALETMPAATSSSRMDTSAVVRRRQQRAVQRATASSSTTRAPPLVQHYQVDFDFCDSDDNYES